MLLCNIYKPLSIVLDQDEAAAPQGKQEKKNLYLQPFWSISQPVL